MTGRQYVDSLSPMLFRDMDKNLVDADRHSQILILWTIVRIRGLIIPYQKMECVWLLWLTSRR